MLSDFDLLAGEWMATDAARLETMQKMTAEELMTSPPDAIGEVSTPGQQRPACDETHVSRLLVTDENGLPVGVISISDLVAPLGRPTGKRRKVSDVMSYGIVTCRATTPLDAAARAMAERRPRSIVVIDDDRTAVGLITGSALLPLYLRRAKTQNGCCL